jgi:hypothetical protein
MNYRYGSWRQVDTWWFEDVSCGAVSHGAASYNGEIRSDDWDKGRTLSKLAQIIYPLRSMFKKAQSVFRWKQKQKKKTNHEQLYPNLLHDSYSSQTASASSNQEPNPNPLHASLQHRRQTEPAFPNPYSSSPLPLIPPCLDLQLLGPCLHLEPWYRPIHESIPERAPCR